MSDQSKSTLVAVQEKVNSLLAKYPVVDDPLKKLSAKIGVDKSFVAIAAALLPLLFIFMLGTGEFVIDVIGFGYPAYASIRAIESETKTDDTQWLTYWLVFAMFKIVEGVADFFLQMIPFYFYIKAAFLVYCFYPTTMGAKVIYDSVIKPFIVPKLGLSESSSAKKDM